MTTVPPASALAPSASMAGLSPQQELEELIRIARSGRPILVGWETSSETGRVYTESAGNAYAAGRSNFVLQQAVLTADESSPSDGTWGENAYTINLKVRLNGLNTTEAVIDVDSASFWTSMGDQGEWPDKLITQWRKKTPLVPDGPGTQIRWGHTFDTLAAAFVAANGDDTLIRWYMITDGGICHLASDMCPMQVTGGNGIASLGYVVGIDGPRIPCTVETGRAPKLGEVCNMLPIP